MPLGCGVDDADGLNMAARIVPLIHVPDVQATIAWYLEIGFELAAAHEDPGESSWAMLNYGESSIMLSSGGVASTEFRREFDLYIHVDDVEATFEKVKACADPVEGLHETFYGMREFIIRDCNRFWITFGQPSARSSET